MTFNPYSAREISDPELRYLIAGSLSSLANSDKFPIDIKAVVRIDNEEGQADAFRIITKSGLKYRVDVSYEEPQ